MKKLALILFGILLIDSYKGQNEVNINFQDYLGSEEFALNMDVEVDGYQLYVDRLQYYVSDIVITHDGGLQTDIESVWLLVDPSEQQVYSLGNWDIETVENISFYTKTYRPDLTPTEVCYLS